MVNVGFELEITELRLGLPGRTRRSDREHGEKGNNVVGWPPVCSYRRMSIGSEKECIFEETLSKKLVKISMDGVPFLRKIDVSCFQEYSHFVAAFEKLFGCSGLKEALEDADNCEYVLIYEDKDGDWLLVGDVPWNMFAESCRRLRIMKSGDAKSFELQCKK
ncbi:hypothetical protein vseg_007198 [Gypsophila vaccaria]